MFRKSRPALFLLLVSHLLAATGQKGQAQTPAPQEWTILETYTIAGKASGLAWDGNNIYFGMYGSAGFQFYKVDPATGSYALAFNNPAVNDTYGMTCDGTDLWITDHGLASAVPAYALQLDLSGNILSQFDLPDHYMSGIAYDNGEFWVCTYYPDPGTIYKVDASGAVITQIPSPDEQPWDICIENENLWVADYNGNKLYKIDKFGNVLEEHACENEKPAGIVYDGQYLWYVDGPLSAPSTLYKVSLTGAGNPQIEVPVTQFDFGNVAIGDSVTWACSITNSGTADLEISGIVVQNAAPIFISTGVPIIIPPGSTDAVDLTFKPSEPGPLSTTVVIESNDPVDPEVELELSGEALYSGAHVQISASSHDYGTVRIQATTRWLLEVQNDGSEPVQLTGLAFDDPAFYAAWDNTFPITIDVLETRALGIWFRPAEFQYYEAVATLSHDAPGQETIEITLEGTGHIAPYPAGEPFWQHQINTSYDNSVKAISTIADVSGDGIDDVVVCSEDDFVRCFNGNASGTADILWEQEAGTVNGQVGLTTIDDIDADGYPDVIVGLAWGIRAVKALSGRTGEQLWAYYTNVYGDGGWVYQVWAGTDYNGDGITDVLAATGNDGNNGGPKRVFCLDGTDGSVVWDNNTGGPNFACMGIADFTGDGLPDVVAGASTNNETEGKVYGIDGADGTLKWTYTTAGTSVWALEQLDDINGDGIKDIIAGDFGGNYYLLDAATGSMLHSGSAGSAVFIRFERLDDVNGNGYADIAFAYSGTNAIVVDGYDGSNLWLTPLADKCWVVDRLDDITGDGISDLIAGTLYSSNFCYFLDGSTGEVIHSISYSEPLDAIGALADINGDGSQEMVAGGRNGTLTCYSAGPAQGFLSAAFTVDANSGPAPLEVQFLDLSIGDIVSWAWDFDSDGTVDATDQDPQHTFETPGIYSVTLAITDGTTSDTLTKADHIEVLQQVVIGEVRYPAPVTAHPNPFQYGNEVSIAVTSRSIGRLVIRDLEGRMVRSLNPISYTADRKTFTWDGTSEAGQPCRPGVYLVTASGGDVEYALKIILR